jgi:protein-disulfide isomerase
VKSDRDLQLDVQGELRWEAGVLELARKLQLAAADLEVALEESKYRTRVRTDFAGGARSGVNGTPTFFTNGQRHDGPFEYEDLRGSIEKALGEGARQ